ncbi:MAG: hypothetical protein ABEH56_00240 [Salinirussus sp.]
MPTQETFTDAIADGRDELVRTLAAHRILPTVVEESGGSDLPGMSTAPTFRLDAEAGPSDVADRQTTTQVADTLGLASADDCQAVREEIREHSAWSDEAGSAD